MKKLLIVLASINIQSAELPAPAAYPAGPLAGDIEFDRPQDFLALTAKFNKLLTKTATPTCCCCFDKQQENKLEQFLIGLDSR